MESTKQGPRVQIAPFAQQMLGQPQKSVHPPTPPAEIMSTAATYRKPAQGGQGGLRVHLKGAISWLTEAATPTPPPPVSAST